MVGKALSYAAALLLCLSTQAHAMCIDDLKDMKPHIDRLKIKDLPRYNVALKWWTRAMEAEPGSEVECLNLLHRTRIALSQQLPELTDNCIGPNAYLPNCQGGIQNGTVGDPVGPVTSIGGGGGAGSGGAGPAGPVTQGGGPPLIPPDSVDRGAIDQ
jgi:hypothetical protein